MYKIGFDNQMYLDMQSKHISERIEMFGNKLYLEFGGKLFDDYHASRVLPGFEVDCKVRLLATMSDKTEIVIAISALDIELNKLRGDFGITYDSDVLRLIDSFRQRGLFVGSVVITRYSGQISSDNFKSYLESLGMKVFLHHFIADYPTNIQHALSGDGFGKSDYIETSRPLVVITAPGPGSGKMSACLSQMYHEHQRGVRAGYAKFETFPVWDLPLKHPVNLAYEAATVDLNDVNMIDPFHLEAYGESAVNYNRDVEVFPILNAMFKEIWNESPYNSPTDMGVNMVCKCIIDDEVCKEASKQEIVRRYYNAMREHKRGNISKSAVQKLELLMNRAGVTVDDRAIVKLALDKASETGSPSVAIELPDGTRVTGKTSALLGASSAALLNALKKLAGIDSNIYLLSPNVIEPIQRMKTEFLHNSNPRLHTDEVLIALAICTTTNPIVSLVLEQLPKLINSEVHSTVILSQVDTDVFRKLGMNVTCEPHYQSKKLFHKR